MASLTTVYMVSTVLGSLGSMAAGYIANRISGPQPKPEIKPEVTAEPVDVNLKNLIVTKFTDPKITPDIADIMVKFIVTPVEGFGSNYNEYSSDLKKIYKATHPDKKQCPGNLGKLCGLIFNKARSVNEFIKTGTKDDFTENLTDRAIEILSSDNQ